VRRRRGRFSGSTSEAFGDAMANGAGLTGSGRPPLHFQNVEATDGSVTSNGCCHHLR